MFPVSSNKYGGDYHAQLVSRSAGGGSKTACVMAVIAMSSIGLGTGAFYLFAEMMTRPIDAPIVSHMTYELSGAKFHPILRSASLSGGPAK